MKRILSFALCVVMLFSLVACGPSATKPKEPNPEAFNILIDYILKNGQSYDSDGRLIFSIYSDENTPDHMSAFGNLRCGIKYELDEDIINFIVFCDCSSFPYSWSVNDGNEINAWDINCIIEIDRNSDKYNYRCTITLDETEDVYPTYWVTGYIYAPTSNKNSITIAKTNVNTLYMDEDDELTELLLNDYSLKAINFINNYINFLNIGISLYDLGFTSFE